MDPFSIATLIFAAINAIAGGINAAAQTDAQMDDLQKRKAREEELKKDVLADMDLNFNTKKDEANKSADRSDKQSDFNEGAVSQNVNNQIDALKARQEKETADFNSMLVQIGQAEGNSLTQNAGSGTRTGNSVAQAVDLQKAMNMNQLQLEENEARGNDNIGLANVLQNLAQNTFGIQSDRTDAYDLRQSFEEGGSQYNIYKSKRDMTEKQYNNSIKDMQDAYDDLNANKFWNVLGGMFGGARTGLAAGQSIGRLASDLNLNTTAKANTTMNFNNLNLGNWGKQSGLTKTFSNLGGIR